MATRVPQRGTLTHHMHMEGTVMVPPEGRVAAGRGTPRVSQDYFQGKMLLVAPTLDVWGAAWSLGPAVSPASASA